MMTRRELLVAVGMAGALGCASARVDQSTRDQAYRGHIGRIVAIVMPKDDAEAVLADFLADELAKRRILTQSFVIVREADLDSRRATIDAFAPDAWLRVSSRERVVDQYGVLLRAHYDAGLTLTEDFERRVWRADVVYVPGISRNTRSGMQAVAARIAERLVADRLAD